MGFPGDYYLVVRSVFSGNPTANECHIRDKDLGSLVRVLNYLEGCFG